MILDLLLALLIALLGHDNFYVRQQASNDLGTMIELALPTLRATAPHHPDPEVRRRASNLVEDWRSSFRPTGLYTYPWIDQLPDTYPDKFNIVGKYRQLAMEIGGYMVYDEWNNSVGWLEYRHATILWVDDLILEGKSRKEINQMLDQMVKRESAYHRSREEAELIPAPQR